MADLSLLAPGFSVLRRPDQVKPLQPETKWVVPTPPPQPPGLSYAGFGAGLKRTTRRLQAGGIFDQQVVTPPTSLLQRAVTALLQPKTLLGS